MVLKIVKEKSGVFLVADFGFGGAFTNGRFFDTRKEAQANLRKRKKKRRKK